MERASWVDAAGVAAVVCAGAITLWLIGASLLRSMRARLKRLVARPDDEG